MPSGERRFHVYIMRSASGVLYVGVTNDLVRRVYEHKCHLVRGFTDRYNVTQLVYYEEADGPYEAISREKQIKGWRREKKTALIRQMNPGWAELAADWYEDV